MSISAPLHSLVGVSAGVWRAHALAAPLARVVATGDAALDAQLPGGGWPVGALTEVLQAPGVHGEWRLLLSALARCGSAAVVLVGAPHTPFGPALAVHGLAPQRLLWVTSAQPAQRLWVTEQALRCAGVDAVLAWLPQARSDQLRRLQMVAGEFSRLLFVMRAGSAQQESSPAVLRLLLQPQDEAPSDAACAHSDGLQVHFLKRRGPPLEQPVCLAAWSPPQVVLEAAARCGQAGAVPAAFAEGGNALDRTAARA